MDLQEHLSPPNNFGGGVLTGLVMTPDPFVTPENELMSLPSTPDPFAMTPDSMDSERDVNSFEKKHVIDVYRGFGGVERVSNYLTQILAEKLHDCGVACEINPRTSRSKSRKSPRINKEHSNGIHVRNQIYKASQRKRLAEVRLKSSGTKMSIPFIIKETCDFIREHIKDEGILRKSGSSSRAACIMQRFMSPENDDYFSTFDTVYDVANVLKQYLRELEVPMIPYSIQSSFLKCLDISSEVLRNECLAMCTCLLPSQNISILSYVLEFLAEVSNYSEDNLMTAENLAIVMGPNIMPVIPVDQRKQDKNKETHHHATDRHTLDQHNKIIELLILNSNSVGRIDMESVKRLESFVTLRSSEDELENEGAGRRKKRRSGSLNRMLGFLKKVTSSKGGETPNIPSTPGLDSFTHTPIIKNSSRKKTTEENLFSMYKKKNLLDGVRKNGLHFKDSDAKSELCSTPNTLTGLLAYPSPAVCLDPSPMRNDWKQTPSGNRLKNFVTPSLLRKRDKTSEAKTAFSAPAKGAKSRIRFGKKTAKKQDSPRVDEKPFLPKGVKTASTMSIHNLVSSPRATLHRNPSSKIPRGDKPAIPPKKNLSLGKLRVHSSNGSQSQDRTNVPNTNDSGDYVTISNTAEMTDVKNEAFIASSISLTDSEYEPLNFRKLNSNVTEFASSTTDESILEPPPNIELMDISVSTPNRPEMRLTPMIKEIDLLTKTAEQLTLSTLKGKSASSLHKMRSHTLPESPTELNTTPLNVEQVETKFIKALKEAKITKIVSEASKPTMTVNLQRRLSVQDRGISPSQRRIISSARRRSHEISRVTPVVSATFSSMRSPKTQDSAATNSDKRGLRRSPTTRCTLRRGRPNTTRVGLARPSPAKNTPPRSCASSKMKVEVKSTETQNFGSTPMRRMSSVQELVKKLETEKQQGRRDRANTFPDAQSTSIDTTKPVAVSSILHEASEIQTRSKSNGPNALKLSVDTCDGAKRTDCSEEEWVAAHKFAFSRKDLKCLRKNTERDSIHYLKTLRAGKVPATVEFFNKIGKPVTSKSPSRSMIPRYTALHRSESSRSNLHDSKPSTPEDGSKVNRELKSKRNPPTPTRRLSSIDIRQKHEELLENIKKERSIKRSATTAAAYQSSAMSATQNQRRVIQRNASTSLITSTSSTKRSAVVETSDTISSPAPRQLPHRSNSRRTPSSKTPKIAEEDESLTVTVLNAIDTLLGKSPCNVQAKRTSKLSSTSSPLKSSNIANIQFTPAKQVHGAPKRFDDVMTEDDEKSGIMTRTRSERGTRSSSATAPKVTPKIKKALTTRAFDLKGTPNPRSTAHKCPTITPMRRYPQKSENRHLTPMKATYTPQSKVL